MRKIETPVSLGAQLSFPSETGSKKTELVRKFWHRTPLRLDINGSPMVLMSVSPSGLCLSNPFDQLQSTVTWHGPATQMPLDPTARSFTTLQAPDHSGTTPVLLEGPLQLHLSQNIFPERLVWQEL